MSSVESSRTRTSTRFAWNSLPVRLLLALAGGSVAFLVYPRAGVWALMYPMLILLYLAGRGLGFWKGAFVGLIAGVSFFASQTFWLSQYLGPEPLIVLAGGEGIIFAVFFGAATFTAKQIKRSGLSRAFGLAGIFAVFWIAREWFSGTYPYGGFPWAKLVMAQSDTSVARWVWLGGMPFASFLIAFVTILAVELALQRVWTRTLAISSLAFSVLVFAPWLLPISNAAEDGELRIAAVQGNANAGLFTNRVSGKIRDNHIAGSKPLIESGEDFDALVWPENAVDVDVFGDPENYRSIDSFVSEVGKPLVFGTITKRDKYYNSSLLWEPGQGKTDWYDKRRPVPFAEYVPDRPFWYWVSPDLISLINYDYAFGERDGIFKIKNESVGTLICFEIAIDEVSRDLVNNGAKLILSQTNNADFGKSDQAYQQLAIARVRAIETGRALVNISTVGPSAIFLPDGSVVDQLDAYTRDSMVETLPLRVSKTPATFLASPIENGAAMVSVALLGIAMFQNRRDKKR